MLIGLYLYLPEHFGLQKGQKLLGSLCFLSEAGMASGLATEMLFSSQFPVVDVGNVWMVMETFPQSVLKDGTGEKWPLIGDLDSVCYSRPLGFITHVF